MKPHRPGRPEPDTLQKLGEPGIAELKDFAPIEWKNRR